MVKHNLIKIDDLVDNPVARVPICLCLDTSGSMNGEPLQELNRGIEQFFKELQLDETAKYAAEIAIVTFGEQVKTEAEFQSLYLQQEVPQISEAIGRTPMGEGVNRALDLLADRKQSYKEAGVDYFQPWLVLMTDGKPFKDRPGELDRAIKRIEELVGKEGKSHLTIFPIGIGDKADMSILAKLSPKRVPVKLKGLKFAEFFSWLSKSVSKTSQSMPGDKVELDIEGMKGWATLD